MGISPAISLAHEQLEMLSAIERADLWFVAERLERKGLLAADEIPAAILEFKRFMALIGLGHRGLEMASPKVDEVWHAFILFTREYAAFCQDVFGEFIHHVPRTSRTPAGAPGEDRFAQAYPRAFGEASAVWGGLHAQDCGEGDCSGEARSTPRSRIADCGEGECTGEGSVVGVPGRTSDHGTEDGTAGS
ncbi:MAG: hypothetical protein WD906_00680 [Anaerolineales bacterium]